jgi:hypothetical protein
MAFGLGRRWKVASRLQQRPCHRAQTLCIQRAATHCTSNPCAKCATDALRVCIFPQRAPWRRCSVCAQTDRIMWAITERHPPSTPPARRPPDWEPDFTEVNNVGTRQLPSVGLPLTMRLVSLVLLLAGSRNFFTIEPFHRLYFENLRSALADPGDWFLARNGTVFYKPRAGEKPETRSKSKTNPRGECG